jgi:hypothetical protein
MRGRFSRSFRQRRDRYIYDSEIMSRTILLWRGAARDAPSQCARDRGMLTMENSYAAPQTTGE